MGHGNRRGPLGSSPRVRGTHFNRAREGRVFGIIPACAGNTGACPSRRCAPGDHPRVCGEHPEKVQAVEADAGSSPRVRGTRQRLLVGAVLVGIIPACAGNTNSSRHRASRTRDHPRVCGEHPSLSYEDAMSLGSSPRVRGTRLVADGESVRQGIIPACAGNTIPTFWISRSRAGSSPRVRGTLADFGLQSVDSGIIPACAGNTHVCLPLREPFGDHPRVCGEHYVSGCSFAMRVGSSPRVRGTLTLEGYTFNADGIIPACAGNTPARA